ncbi:hypothetical protein CEUSTIGMA_g12156.t1 [Chlamydomonas eustigma]|uniref:Uncharacterized protein n=1 Tax=Chlamydomonas eustigma TaxID=1157962 RepID=A0A250XNR9_9CHLO|nr:hypothetical protein CEUSTIGMA_g12156.t1 [Chlamydomonas eustigma]|eukprot:GAX84734.1 hypothetical protein CEUSTIGMA_g12156.t1 [Chlamydomonas eustigma]
MVCCGKHSGEQAIDPATNKPVVTVGAGVLDAPTSAAAAAAAYGTPNAMSRLPPFFFVKMPDPEPEDEVQIEVHQKEVAGIIKDADGNTNSKVTPPKGAGDPISYQQNTGGGNNGQEEENSRDVVSSGLRPDQTSSSAPPTGGGDKGFGHQMRPDADFYRQGPLQPNNTPPVSTGDTSAGE